MKVAINCKKTEDKHLEFIRELMDLVSSKKIDFLLNEDLDDDSLQGIPTYNHTNLPHDIDFFLSVGGDGTLLNTITYIGARKIPILGINTGRLGFLVTSKTEEIHHAIDQLEKGDFEIESRALINLKSSTDYFGNRNFALNEVAILKQDTSSMITIHVKLNGEYLNTYWADGLVVSTPTGSTGYSLSCGGPVVIPGSENFIISPVCPHNLNVRPMVINDSSSLDIEVETRGDNFLLVLDSRSEVVTNPLKIVLTREVFDAKIIKLGQYSYLDTLRKKLLWGSDVRN